MLILHKNIFIKKIKFLNKKIKISQFYEIKTYYVN